MENPHGTETAGREARMRRRLLRRGSLHPSQITMIVVVFRARLHASANLPELETLGARMYELARTIPGFVSYKDFGAADGEGVSIVELESEEALNAWRDHPEHMAAKARGRLEFFSEYDISVCSIQRRLRYKSPDHAAPHETPSIPGR